MASTNDTDLRRLYAIAEAAEQAYQRQQRLETWLTQQVTKSREDDLQYYLDRLDNQRSTTKAAQLQAALAMATLQLAQFEAVYGHVRIDDGVDDAEDNWREYMAIYGTH